MSGTILRSSHRLKGDPISDMGVTDTQIPPADGLAPPVTAVSPPIAPTAQAVISISTESPATCAPQGVSADRGNRMTTGPMPVALMNEIQPDIVADPLVTLKRGFPQTPPSKLSGSDTMSSGSSASPRSASPTKRSRLDPVSVNMKSDVAQIFPLPITPMRPLLSTPATPGISGKMEALAPISSIPTGSHSSSTLSSQSLAPAIDLQGLEKEAGPTIPCLPPPVFGLDAFADVADDAAAATVFGNATPSGQSGPVIDDSTVYLEDTEIFVSEALPDTCGVTDVKLQDEFLAVRGYYNNLPKLNAYRFTPTVDGSRYGDVSGQGRFRISLVSVLCPAMKIKLALAPMVFVSSGRYINPARATPLLVKSRLVGLSGRKELIVTRDTAIMVSTALVYESFLLALRPGQQYPKHYINLLFPCQDWERYCAFMCTGFGVHELGANIWKDAIEFQTKSISAGGADVAPANAIPDIPGLFNSYRSPVKVTKPNAPRPRPRPLGNRLGGLGLDERVPVYDGRKTSINYDKDLDKLETLLPPYPTDPPRGSLVVVGSVSHIYTNKGAWRYTNYIRWLVVIGIPANA